MSRLAPAARLWGRKVLRYSLVSLISIAVSQSVLMVAFGMLHWTARLANVAACAVATVPSYYLNRSWAWGRRSRSHLWKEVVPFWALAFLGLALSTWAADVASTLARQAGASHAATTAIVMSASLLAFGILWVGKFAIFNALLFAERPAPTHLRIHRRRRLADFVEGYGSTAPPLPASGSHPRHRRHPGTERMRDQMSTAGRPCDGSRAPTLRASRQSGGMP